MKKTLLTASCVALFALGGCAGTDGGPSYNELVAQAKAEMAKAKKMNYLWRDTGKILKKAEAARADGNNPKANKLAKKALNQAIMAQQQAKEQAGSGPVYLK